MDKPGVARVHRKKIIVVFELQDVLFDMATERLLPGVPALAERLMRAEINMAAMATEHESSLAKAHLLLHNLNGFFQVVVGNNSVPDAVSNGPDLEYGRRLEIAVNSFGIKRTAFHPLVFVVDGRPERAAIAREKGFNYIAVTTGGAEKRAFQRAGVNARMIFDDLSDTQKVFGAILRGGSTQPKRQREKTRG